MPSTKKKKNLYFLGKRESLNFARASFLLNGSGTTFYTHIHTHTCSKGTHRKEERCRKDESWVPPKNRKREKFFFLDSSYFESIIPNSLAQNRASWRRRRLQRFSILFGQFASLRRRAFTLSRIGWLSQINESWSFRRRRFLDCFFSFSLFLSLSCNVSGWIYNKFDRLFLSRWNCTYIMLWTK